MCGECLARVEQRAGQVQSADERFREDGQTDHRAEAASGLIFPGVWTPFDTFVDGTQKPDQGRGGQLELVFRIALGHGAEIFYLVE